MGYHSRIFHVQPELDLQHNGKNDIMNSILHINGYPTDPATWGVVGLGLTGYSDLGEFVLCA